MCSGFVNIFVFKTLDFFYQNITSFFQTHKTSALPEMLHFALQAYLHMETVMR